MENTTPKEIRQLKKEYKQLRAKFEDVMQKLAMVHKAFLSIVGKSQDSMVIVNRERTVLYANFMALSLFDCNLTDLLGEPFKLSLDLDRLSEDPETPESITINQDLEGEKTLEAFVLPTEWQGEESYVVTLRDITERKRSAEMLDYLATHDYLTDLPNRIAFERGLKNAIKEAKLRGSYMALLYMDLDNFKLVNDALGHDMGDLLLKQVSNVLQEVVRAGDTVSRLGGDEFAIILHSLRSPQDAAEVAQKILVELSKVFEIRGQDVYINASIGIAAFPQSGQTEVELVKNADIAMYRAKQKGKNQYHFFSEALNKRSEVNLQLVNGLRSMLQKDELFLLYQPIFELDKMTCIGVEALLRWEHPTLGLVPPDEFLPFAEESGMMPSIGRWVFREALKDIKSLSLPVLCFLSINLSAQELEAAKVVEMIVKEIQTMDFITEQLILELTETSVMLRPTKSTNKLKQLAEMGIRIAIDDFGTGYSSLAYLKQLPISLLKMDKSFIKDIGKDKSDEVIVKAAIQLGHSLGLKVIAEGVETQKQLDFLKAESCDYAQGFLFSKPMSIDALKTFIKTTT